MFYGRPPETQLVHLTVGNQFSLILIFRLKLSEMGGKMHFYKCNHECHGNSKDTVGNGGAWPNALRFVVFLGSFFFVGAQLTDFRKPFFSGFVAFFLC